MADAKNPWLFGEQPIQPGPPAVDPATARRSIWLQGETGQPAASEVDRALAEQMAAEKARREALKDAPRIEKWRAQSEENSTVSHDDGEHLGWLEKTLKVAEDLAGAVRPGSGIAKGISDLVTDPEARDRAGSLLSELGNAPKFWGQGSDDVDRLRLRYRKEYGGGLNAEQDERLRVLEEKRRLGALIGSDPQTVGGQAYRALPMTGSIMVRSLDEGLWGSLLGAGAGLVGGSAVAPGPGSVVGARVGAQGGFELGMTFGAAKEGFELNVGALDEELADVIGEDGARLTPTERRVTALAGGALVTALDTYGFGSILKASGLGPGDITKDGLLLLLRRKEVRAAVTDIVSRYGESAFKEGSTEALQALVEVLAVNQGKDAAERRSGDTFERPSVGQVVEQMKAEGTVGAIVGGAFTTPGVAADLTRMHQAEGQAKARGKLLASLGTAPDSKLRAELPEKYREAAEAITKGGPVESLYVTAEPLMQLFQSQGVEPKEALAALGLPDDALETALREGGEIKLPLATYLSKVLGTELEAGIQKHVKFRPGDQEMTLAEAEDFRANYPDIVKALEEEAAGKAGMAEERRASRASMRARIAVEYGKDKGFTPEQVATMADFRVETYEAVLQFIPGMSVEEYEAAFPIELVRSHYERGAGARLGAPAGPVRPSVNPTGPVDMTSYEAVTVDRESKGKNNAKALTSSALGPHQFIDTTWRGVVAAHGLPGVPNAKEIAKSIRVRNGRVIVETEDQRRLMAMRTNRAASSAAFQAFTTDNQTALRKGLGREPTAGELYIAHFSGIGGALKLLKADPNAAAAEVLPSAAAANGRIFYEGRGKARKSRTVAEVVAELTKDHGGATFTAGAASVEGGVDTPIADLPEIPTVELPEGGQVFDQFAGRRALTSDMGKLRVAQLMEKRDASREEIWAATGWLRGADDQWRFEIDDSQATMKDGALELFVQEDLRQQIRNNPALRTSPERLAMALEPQLTLGQVLDHPALFAAYPKLANVPVLAEAMPKGMKGAFDPETGEIAVSQRETVDGPISTIMHEVQHIIQAVEGFAGGAGSSERDLRGGGYAAALDQTIAQMVATYAPASRGNATDRLKFLAAAVFETYETSEGEIEARNTQDRLNLTAEERRAAHPDRTRDIPHGAGHVVVASDKLRGRYLSAIRPQGETYSQGAVDAAPNAATRAAADAYVAEHKPTSRTAPLAPVEVDEELMKRIADEYDDQVSKPNDPEVRRLYEVAAREIMAQAEFMGDLEIELMYGAGEPYANSDAMRDDVLLRGRMRVYATTPETFGTGNPDDLAHPFLAETDFVDVNDKPLLVNDLFRAVHDYFGHATSEAGFGPKGELNAFLEHAAMFSDEALRVIAPETLMQNAKVNFGRHLRRADGSLPQKGDSDYIGLADRPFADQKAFAVPQWVLREVFQRQEQSDTASRLAEREEALLRSYRGARESLGLAPDASRIEPLPAADGKLVLTHWGRRKGLKALDPRHWGANAAILTRSERNAVENDDVPRRTYYGLNVGDAWGYSPEPGLGPHRYQARLKPDKLYDFDADPEGLLAVAAKAIEEGDWSPAERGLAYERAIADAGHTGYWTRHPNLGTVAAVFERLPAEQVGDEGQTFYQSDVFYSALGRAVEESKTTKAPAQQWAATLQKTPGVKRDELEWSGVEDWLAMREGPVSRDDLLAFVNDNGVKLDAEPSAFGDLLLFRLPGGAVFHAALKPPSVAAGSVQPETGEPASDGLPAEALLLADAVEPPSLASAALRQVEVDDGKSVEARVVAAIRDLQIVEAVVARVSVDVVNDLAGEQGATDGPLDDVSMDADNLPADPDALVSLRAQAVQRLVAALADLRAERVGAAAQLAGLTADNLAALETGNLHAPDDALLLTELQYPHHQPGAGGLIHKRLVRMAVETGVSAVVRGDGETIAITPELAEAARGGFTLFQRQEVRADAFHGSPRNDLTVLEPSQRGAMGPGVYLSPHEVVAARYSGIDGRTYPVTAEGIFNGLGSMLMGSSVNPYEVWREQTAELLAATREDQREALAGEVARLGPSDGYQLYRAAERVTGSSEAATGLFRAAGFKGLAGMVDGPEIVMFDAVSVPLEQGENDRSRRPIRRGAITLPGSFGRGGQAIIDLFAGRDLSTLAHEASGHFVFEQFRVLIASGKASPELVAMGEALLAWFNVPSWDDVGVREHEMFADALEQYLYEGRAPSLRLRSLFATQRAWMVGIYGKTKGVRADVTDEVRAVFDRLLASHEELEAARQAQMLEPLFADKDLAAMPPEVAAAYRQIAASARRDAEDDLDRELLAALVREQKAWYQAEKERVREEVEADVVARPEYRAFEWLAHGKWLGDEPQPEWLGDPVKLNRDALVAQYGGKDILKSLKRGFGRVYAEDGAHPDVVAEAFGFESGSELIDALTKLEGRNAVVNRETDARMVEEHGDPMVDGTAPATAIAALHNTSQQRLIELELQQLQGRPAMRGMREAADAATQRRLVKDIEGSDRHLASERKAANAAMRAFRGGDTAEAARQKFRQLTAFHTWAAARRAEKDIEKADRLFARVTGGKVDNVAKARNMDLIMAARAILAQHGIGRVDGQAQGYIATVAALDPDLFATLGPEIAAAIDGAKGDTRELTFEELMALRSVVGSLYARARADKVIELDGRQIEIEQASSEIADQLWTQTPLSAAEGTENLNDGQKFLIGMAGLRASLRRVESWMKRVDNGIGPLTRYLWRPISEGADAHRAYSGRFRAAYAELLRGIAPSLTWAKIGAPELRHTFANKAELLHAVLHTGNDSNKRKLLLGGQGQQPWAEESEDGNLNTASWDSFVTRMIREGVLTKADYDFAQGVWDLLEETKPDAQRAHRRLFGRYFAEVTANPFSTPFGNYRGGYVPASVNTSIVPEGGIRAEAERIEGGGSFMFPAPAKGFTMSRVESYTKPLALDLRLLSGHIDKVSMFVHLAVPVNDALRLLKRSDVAEALQRFDPSATTDMLLPWLARAAKQIVSTPTGGKGGALADSFFRELRSRTGLNTMFANLTNSLQQFTGWSLSLVAVRPRHLNAALFTYLRSPSALAEAARQASPFMADRLDNQSMEASQDLADMLTRPTLYGQGKAFIVRHGYFLQHAFQNIVDLTTWSAAHSQAVEDGADMREATRRADAAVRQTQGSLNPEDISRFESGPPVARMFTQFASYFNMQANLLATEGGMAARSGRGARLAWVILMGFTVPAILADAIKRGMTGGFDDEDDDGYLDEVFDWLFMSQVRGGLAMIPIAGPTINASINLFNDKPYDDKLSLSPGVGAMEAAVRTPANVYDLATGEGDWSRTAKDALTLLGLALGLPLNALGRPVGYGLDVMEGDVTPTDPVDAVRGVVTGNPSPASRE